MCSGWFSKPALTPRIVCTECLDTHHAAQFGDLLDADQSTWINSARCDF